MSTDFHALCTELLQPLAEYDDANPYHEHRALIARARAALDQIPAAGPTDEQIADLAEQYNGDPVPAIRRALELRGSPAAPPLIVPDTRRPGASMQLLTMRLPPALVADLDELAARLGCSRVALIRTLLTQGVAQLKEVLPVEQEAAR
jgi:hypothetical protein